MQIGRSHNGAGRFDTVYKQHEQVVEELAEGADVPPSVLGEPRML